MSFFNLLIFLRYLTQSGTAHLHSMSRKMICRKVCAGFGKITCKEPLLTRRREEKLRAFMEPMALDRFNSVNLHHRHREIFMNLKGYLGVSVTLWSMIFTPAQIKRGPGGVRVRLISKLMAVPVRVTHPASP